MCSADRLVCNDLDPPVPCNCELVAMPVRSQPWKQDAEWIGRGAAPYFPACYTLLQLYSQSHGAPQ